MTLETAERERLEAERDFLLKSLDDLDDELRAGNIEPDQYRTLHDDYTARAAAVITTLDDGVERRLADAPRAPRAMRILTACGLVAFAVLAGFLLAHAVGQRHAGQTITGNSQSAGNGNGSGSAAGDTLASLRAAAAAQPKSYDAQIVYARALLAAGQFQDAITQYVVASKLDTKQAEPLAYVGWISALAARQTTDAKERAQLFDAAVRGIDAAIGADPSYVPAYAFKGVTLSVFEGKACAGVPALQQYLALAPDTDPLRNQVESALAAAVKAGKCQVSVSAGTTVPTSKP